MQKNVKDMSDNEKRELVFKIADIMTEAASDKELKALYHDDRWGYLDGMEDDELEEIAEAYIKTSKDT